MTTKELTEVAGVSERTIRRIAKNNLGIHLEKGKKALYTESEAIEIMRLARKKGFIQPRQNAEVVRQNAEVVTKSDLAAFGTAIVSEVIKQLMPMILASSGHPATSAIESKQTPKLAPRDELRMIVNKAAKESGDFSGTWKTLYTEIYYRLHINATERAKNAKTTAIDILDSENLLEDAILIAKDIF